MPDSPRYDPAPNTSEPSSAPEGEAIRCTNCGFDQFNDSVCGLCGFDLPEPPVSRPATRAASPPPANERPLAAEPKSLRSEREDSDARRGLLLPAVIAILLLLAVFSVDFEYRSLWDHTSHKIELIDEHRNPPIHHRVLSIEGQPFYHLTGDLNAAQRAKNEELIEDIRLDETEKHMMETEDPPGWETF